MRRALAKTFAAAAILGGAALVPAVALPGVGTGSVLDSSAGMVEQVRSRSRAQLRPFRGGRSARSTVRYPTRIRPYHRSARRSRAQLRPFRGGRSARSTVRYPTRIRPLHRSANSRFRATLRKFRLSGDERQKQLEAQAARQRAERQAFERQQEQQRQRCAAWRRYVEADERIGKQSWNLPLPQRLPGVGKRQWGGDAGGGPGGGGGGGAHIRVNPEPPYGC